MALTDLSTRYDLANELHTRPFPAIKAPATAYFLAIKKQKDAAARNKSKDRKQLIALLDRFGAAHPQPDATHYSGVIGKYYLKWESHSEFVTYSIFDHSQSQAFATPVTDVFPQDWLDTMPGARLCSASITIQIGIEKSKVMPKLAKWFVPESLAVSQVLGGQAAICSDFRIDTSGDVRFAVFVDPKMGAQRIGRTVQRLCEIETYKCMAMLGFSKSRMITAELGRLEANVTQLTGSMMGNGAQSYADSLNQLLQLSQEVEKLIANTSYRFGATFAYETIVKDRIQVLGEEKYHGRQTFREFMMRRFDPAMRTVSASKRRLDDLSKRTERASTLLRTQVEVERSAQNQTLLESMDQRAALQLRLQKTVEGLSIVAISYYAVNLLGYVAAPVFAYWSLSKTTALSALAIPVMVCVWLMVKRIRKKLDG